MICLFCTIESSLHIRSPYYGMLQAHGDAMVFLASDLQDPPEHIAEFIPLWEQGYKIVAAQVDYAGAGIDTPEDYEAFVAKQRKKG